MLCQEWLPKATRQDWEIKQNVYGLGFNQHDTTRDDDLPMWGDMSRVRATETVHSILLFAAVVVSMPLLTL